MRFKADLSGEAMREIVQQERDWICSLGHADELNALLADPMRQLQAAVRAVHASWDSDRARRYRQVKVIGERWQTAVIVQQMAAGNRSNEAIRPGMDEAGISLTGVIPCSRVLPSGFRELAGDVKFSASGDDLVDGLTGADSFQPIASLREIAPMLERNLRHIDARLRRFRGTDPEIEFTVERGALSILQARSAETDGHDDPSRFVDPGPPDTRGIGIRGGAFRGRVAFGPADVAALAVGGDPDRVDGVLLLVENPTPDEIPLILSADGLLTVRGGSTSHAAVAVQGIGDKPYCAVMGVSGLRIDAAARQAWLVDAAGQVRHRFEVGDVISIHGQTGEVFAGTRDREAHLADP